VPEPPLATDDEAPAITQAEVIGQYVDDIGRFEALRLKHNALAGWYVKECTDGR
jgi:hypothetical protein